MSTLFSDPSIQAAIYPISVAQYHRMGAEGSIDEKTELIRGVILRKMKKSPLHCWSVNRLLQLVHKSLPEGFFVQSEQPLSLLDSEPEPDISVIRGVHDDYRSMHPSKAELVIEVAITTEAIDRAKAGVYADALVPEYWLVLPEHGTLERFTEPADGGYRKTESFRFDTTIKTELGIVVDLSQLS